MILGDRSRSRSLSRQDLRNNRETEEHEAEDSTHLHATGLVESDMSLVDHASTLWNSEFMRQLQKFTD